MEPEIVYAAIGIGITLILLVFLSLYQTSRASRLKDEKIQAMRKANLAKDDVAPGETPFFIACFRGNNGRFFRVYPVDNELLFLAAGPFFAMIDADQPRGTDERHWMLRSVKMLAVTVGSGAVAAFMVIAVILRAMARNAGFSADIMFLTFGIIAFLAIGLVILVPASLWRITRRAEELDALPQSGLREQAEVDKWSFRATPENVSNLKLALLDQRQNFKPTDEVGCIMSFKHAPTGRWKIETLTTDDTRSAIGAVRRLWGAAFELDDQLVARLTEPKPVAGATGGRADVLPDAVAPPPTPSLARWLRRVGAGAGAKRAPAVAKEKVKVSTYSVNGFGTAVFTSRGLIKWDSNMEDGDSVLAVCVMGIPVIPYRAVHTSNWEYAETDRGVPDGFRYRAFPIRWSWGLVAAAFIKQLWIWVCIAAGFFVMLAILGPAGQWGVRLIFAGIAVALIAIAVPTHMALKRADRRHRDIRLILGRHVLGSSDPAYWSPKIIRHIRGPRETFATDTFAAAARARMAAKDYEPAMYAARLSTALEDRRAGQQLTDEILRQPNVQDALSQLRAEPKDWDKVMPETDWSSVELFLPVPEESAHLATV